MVAVNFARNARLFEYWEKGMTIQQAAEATDTPQGPTGYDYKKFDRYARKGVPVPRKSRSRRRDNEKKSAGVRPEE